MVLPSILSVIAAKVIVWPAGVAVAVLVLVDVGVLVVVLVLVDVGVLVLVLVRVGLLVGVDVAVGIDVLEEVKVLVAVPAGVLVDLGVFVDTPGGSVFVGLGVFVPAGLGVAVITALPTSSSAQPGQPGITPGKPPAAPFSIGGDAPSYALCPNIYEYLNDTLLPAGIDVNFFTIPMVLSPLPLFTPL